MNRSKDLANNTIIIFLGTACTKLISFLLLPLYTGVLDSSEYGIVDLVTTLVSLISPIITFQVEQGLFRYLIDSRKNVKREKELISSAFFLIIINTFVYLFIFLIINSFIKNDYKYYLMFITILCSFSNLLLQISRGFGDNKSYSLGSIITAVITIIFNILFLLSLQMKADGMLLGTLLGYTFGNIYLFCKLKIYKYLSISSINNQSLKKLLKYSLPMIPNSLSWWILGVSDRIIVTLILGISYNGILSIAYKFSSAYIILYNIFDKSWCESIVLHIKDKDIECYFNNTFKIIFNLFLTFGFILISFMPILFKLLINKSYQAAYNLIPITIVASIVQVVVGLVSVVYAGYNDTKSLANTSICSAIINILVHILLINYIGLYAAVISTLCSNLFFAFYRALDVNKKYIRIHFDYKFITIASFVLLFILVIYYSNNFILNIFSGIISVLFAVIVNKKYIKLLKKVILNKIGQNI